MAKIISIDSGSSYMKAYDGTARVRFAAVVKAEPEGDAPNVIRAFGGRYLVGEDALDYFADAPGINDQRTYHGSISQKVQICQALQLLGASGQYDQLTLSLPFSRSRDDDLLPRLCQEYGAFSWEDTSGKRSVEFTSCSISPQGVGALRCFQQMHSQDDLEQVLVVDIGSQTSDVVAVRKRAEGWQYIGGRCTSWHKLATGRFFDSWVQSLDGILSDYPWNYFDIMGRAAEGKLWVPYMGEKVSIKDSFDAQVVRFREALLAAIVEHCGKQLWFNLDKVILTGGGAMLLGNAPWDDPRVVVMDAWSNVTGQHIWAQTQAQARGDGNAAA